MHKYLLPLTINNRRSNVLSMQTSATKAQNFVVEATETSISYNLFSIDKSKSLLSIHTGFADVACAALHFDISQRDTGIFDVFISSKLGEAATPSKPSTHWRDAQATDEKPVSKSINGNQSVDISTIEGASLILQNSSQNIQLNVQLPAHLLQQTINNNSFIICFKYVANNIIFSSNISFSISTQPSLLNLGFDFGSEASQMRFHKYNRIGEIYTPKAEDVNLFQTIKDYKNEDGNDAEYFQYENDSPFFKSVFFTKKTVDGKSTDFDENDFLDNKDDVLLLKKIQTADRLFYDDWMQLPNLKITHKYSQDLLNYKIKVDKGRIKTTHGLHEIKEKLYGTILNEILSAYFFSNSTRVYDVKFTILIPNIYDTIDIYRTRQIFTQIFDRIKNEIPNLRSVEIITLSESDASYMGFYNKGQTFAENDKFYLIIDCGKGTTDFSIVQSDKDSILEYKNLYRNGFAGAGNLLTYSFFEAFCYYIISQANNINNAKQFFKQNFATINDFTKSSLFQQIEKYKINYSSKKSRFEIESEFAQVKSGSINFKNFFDDLNTPLDTFIELMKQCSTCFDWNNYISNTTEDISQMVVANIKQVVDNLNDKIVCGGTLLSGRGFLFLPLKEKLVDKLIKLGIPQGIIHVPQKNKDYKNICMQGVFRKNFIYNPEILCYPVEVLNKKTESEQPTVSIDTAKKGLFSFFTKHFNNLITDELTYQEAENKYTIKQKDFYKLRFIIGNFYFAPSNLNMNTGVRQPELCFDGLNFVIRSFDEQDRLLDCSNLEKETDLNVDDNSFVTASLFPVVLNVSQMDFLNANFEKDNFDLNFMPSFNN